MADDEGARAIAALAAAYADVDGYAIAREERASQRSRGIYVDGVTYGEVSVSGFATVLGWMKPQAGERFFDLGSGTGLAVHTAAAMYPTLDRAVGIEIQPELHAAARRAHAALRAAGCFHGSQAVPCAPVRLEYGDALAPDILAKSQVPPDGWPEEAELVFCTTTCFTDAMLGKLRAGVRRLRQGARVAVTTRGLSGVSGARLLRKGKVTYGKGALTFYVYEMNEDEVPAPKRGRAH